MSRAYESLNLRVSPEAKRLLEQEAARRQRMGRPFASQSAIIEELILRWLHRGEPREREGR